MTLSGIGIAHYDATHPTPLTKTQSIRVVASELGAGSFILGPNCSFKSNGSPSWEYVIAGIPTLIYVTVQNNGSSPVYLNTITMTTNITAGSPVPYLVPSTFASIAPGASQTYPLSVNPTDWPLAWVKLDFVVTGTNDVNGNAVLNVGVLSLNESASSTTSTASTTTTTSTSSTSISTSSVCTVNFQG